MQTEQEINSGNLSILKPRKALNKAFLKVKPNRSQIFLGATQKLLLIFTRRMLYVSLL
jgi:hypothetical protein